LFLVLLPYIDGCIELMAGHTEGLLRLDKE
jgi:hypothetical protein